MSKYYSFDELPEFHKWVLCTANFKKMDNAMGHNAEPFTIEILVNGKDVGLDFLKVLSEVEQQMNTMVENEARELLEDRFLPVIDKLNELMTDVQDIDFGNDG